MVEAIQVLHELGASDGENGGVPVHLMEQSAVRGPRYADMGLAGNQGDHARAALVQLSVVTLGSESRSHNELMSWQTDVSHKSVGIETQTH